MSRLTERFNNGQAAVFGCGTNCKYDFLYCINHSEDCPTITEIYEKLAHYEDLEEQGRLIEQKHGYWTGPDEYDCSECGENYMEVADADAYASGWKPNYCPNCGAKMDEVEK